MRYFLCLSYDGSAFCGWQIQPSSPSVQACLESTLSRLLNRPVAVTGAGRTDTGVHAVNYVAHFDTDGVLPFEASDFIYKLNAMLPRGVAISSVSPWLCGYPSLDFDAMNEACQHLLGTHDFSCFEKTGGDNKTSICTVFEAHWEPYVPSHVQVMGQEGPSGGYWYFRIAADRFLRNMVRATVGTLIEVGRGKHRPEWVAQLIANGTRGDAGESVPGHALFLNKVDY